MNRLKEKMNKLVDAVDSASTDLPPVVEGAVNDLLATFDEQASVPAWKKFFYKNGEFSKTATFATVANVITLTWYALSMFATGEPQDLGFMTLPAIKPLDPTLAVAVLGLADGAYLGNNVLKKKSAEQGLSSPVS